jgi:hypothetical protein
MAAQVARVGTAGHDIQFGRLRGIESVIAAPGVLAIERAVARDVVA